MKTMHVRFFSLLLVSLGLCCTSAWAGKEKIPAAYVIKKGSVVCAYLLGSSKTAGRSWVPAVKVGSSYLSATSAVKDKKLSAKTIKAAKKIVKSKACKVLVEAKNFSSIPEADALFSSSESTTGITTTSGTPPLLSSVYTLSSTDAAALFLRSGVLAGIQSGSPTTQQCTEFSGSSVDGESAGMGMCRLSQDIGDLYTSLIRGKATSCYFRTTLTTANVTSGGLTLVSGSLPTGGAPALLAVPRTSSRTIKLILDSTGNSYNYIKIFSDGENRASGLLYRYDTWNCAALVSGSAPQVMGIKTGTISPTGSTTVTNKFQNAFLQSEYSVEGTLVENSDGTLEYDSTKNRTVTVTQVSSLPYVLLYKSYATLSPDGSILIKSYDQFSTTLRKLLSVGKTTGTSTSSLRIVEGAYRYQIETPSVTRTMHAAAEYRDTTYVAAPSNTLASLVSSSFESDSFYSSAPSLSLDLTSYRCDTTADVVLQMDPTNTTLQASLISCVDTGFVGNLCRGSDYLSAEALSISACS